MLNKFGISLNLNEINIQTETEKNEKPFLEENMNNKKPEEGENCEINYLSKNTQSKKSHYSVNTFSPLNLLLLKKIMFIYLYLAY